MTTAAQPRRRSLGAFLCVCVALAACSDEPEVAEAPFTATPSSAPDTPEAPDPSPTPSPESTLLAPPDEPPPPLMLTGEDFLAIRRSHEAYRGWLYEHPDPAALTALYHTDCRCLVSEQRLMQSYVDLGRWWTGAANTVRSVQVLEHTDPNLVTLRVVIDGPPSYLTDSTQAIFDELPGRVIEQDDVFVRADPSQPWLFRDFIDHSPEGA